MTKIAFQIVYITAMYSLADIQIQLSLSGDSANVVNYARIKIMARLGFLALVIGAALLSIANKRHQVVDRTNEQGQALGLGVEAKPTPPLKTEAKANDEKK